MKEIRTLEHAGHAYMITFDEQTSLVKSSLGYTRCRVYIIRTDNDRWCGSILPMIMEDDSISAGEREFHSDDMGWQMRQYHTIEFDEKLNAYRYTIITPYDDLGVMIPIQN